MSRRSRSASPRRRPSQGADDPSREHDDRLSADRRRSRTFEHRRTHGMRCERRRGETFEENLMKTASRMTLVLVSIATVGGLAIAEDPNPAMTPSPMQTEDYHATVRDIQN